MFIALRVIIEELHASERLHLGPPRSIPLAYLNGLFET